MKAAAAAWLLITRVWVPRPICQERGVSRSKCFSPWLLLALLQYHAPFVPTQTLNSTIHTSHLQRIQKRPQAFIRVRSPGFTNGFAKIFVVASKFFRRIRHFRIYFTEISGYVREKMREYFAIAKIFDFSQKFSEKT